MYGTGARKACIAVALFVTAAVLGSCSRMVVAEPPLQKRLESDVAVYLQDLAGNGVVLFGVAVDRRDYDEKAGTLDYAGTVHFAWDEFNGDRENAFDVRYALEGDAWTLAGIGTDIDPAALDGRVLMRDLYLGTVSLPDSVITALSGADAPEGSPEGPPDSGAWNLALRVILDGTAYTLPAAAAEFRDQLWEPACGWDQPVRAGSFIETAMESRRVETLVAYFVNAGDAVASLRD